MQSQLVLKFRHRAPQATDYIAALEMELAATLGDAAVMDGHDVRAAAVNVFLVCADPATVFRRCKPVLQKQALLDKVVAAHRVVGGASFRVIWPLRWGRRFSID